MTERQGENAEPLRGEEEADWIAYRRVFLGDLYSGDDPQADVDLDAVRNAIDVPKDAGDLAPALEAMLRRIPDGWGRWVAMNRGWYPIIVELDRRLAELDEDYTLCQVKEKFGGLRYYFEPSAAASADTHTAMREAVAEAESMAERTCEECGADGAVLRDDDHRYWQTLCDGCSATRP
jgi:hypothetical protein